MNTTFFVLPSGKSGIMRETNGDDDAILSRFGGISSGDSFLNFISATIEIDNDLKAKPQLEDLRKWPVNDWSAYLLKHRIFNLGELLEQNDYCSNCEKTYDLVLSLKEFDTDIEKFIAMAPEEQTKYKDKFPEALLPYKYGSNPKVEFQVGDVKYRFSILTKSLEAEMEKKYPFEDMNNNTKLLGRNLEYFTGGEWKLKTFFTDVSSRHMSLIRQNVMEADGVWTPGDSAICPHCKNQKIIPNVMSLPGFFFPVVKI